MRNQRATLRVFLSVLCVADRLTYPGYAHLSAAGGKIEFEAEARVKRCAGYKTAEDLRYNERTAAGRVNSAVKDTYGGRFVRVCGHASAKVFCHLMSGILALTAGQLLAVRNIG